MTYKKNYTIVWFSMDIYGYSRKHLRYFDANQTKEMDSFIMDLFESKSVYKVEKITNEYWGQFLLDNLLNLWYNNIKEGNLFMETQLNGKAVFL